MWILWKLTNGHHNLLLAVAFTILLVIYFILWPLYLNPTKADQWPSQACCWLKLILFYLLFILCWCPIMWILWKLTNGHHNLLLAVAFPILLVIYSMLWPHHLNPTKADRWPSQHNTGYSIFPFYLLFILCCGFFNWILQKLTNGHHKPAAGCSFYHSACYLFYDVASLPESYESWPADQWPSQACCWL